MEEFTFEEPICLTKEEFLEIFAIYEKSNRIFRRICFFIVGVILLFFSYTLLLGIAILTLLFVIIIKKETIPWATEYSYKKSHHYHKPVKYGVSNDKLWANFDKFSITSKWENLAVWQKQDKWLRLSAKSLPPLFFKIESLKNAGIYEAVMEKAKTYAVEFNSPEAKKAF